MSSDSDKKGDIQNDAHDSLVKSLESIKDLLLQSESKISAAKASIAKASMGPTKSQRKVTEAETKSSTNQNTGSTTLDFDFSDDFPQPGDDEVPLLDDIVIHGSKTRTGDTGEVHEPQDAPIAPLEAEQINTETLDYLLADFQVRMEKELHEVLIQGVVQLESQMKELLAEEIQRLRDEIKKA